MAPFISTPWIDGCGRPLPIRALPGLRPEALQALRSSYPGLMSPDYGELLGCCSGLAGTALGPIDFTGCWHPAEKCPVYDPCLTLAVDDKGRRWITEMSDDGGPGHVWCLFTDPAVAVHVSDDLVTFVATLRKLTCQGRLCSWLQELTAQAHAIWQHRHSLALRPYQAIEADADIAAWIAALPTDAFVYDLRSPVAARGWPYGLAGPTGRLFRYGRYPVFAVAGPVSEDSRLRDPGAMRLPDVRPRADGHVIPLPARRAERLVFCEPLQHHGIGEQRLCA